VFVGQPIALVFAIDFYSAQDVAERILVSFDELPVVVDAAAAMRSDAPQFYDIVRNTCFEFCYGDATATEMSFCV
jgi:aerobic carbon-monoxide dehydrogenase large subunit